MRRNETAIFVILLVLALAVGCGVKIPEEAAAASNMSVRRYTSLLRFASKEIDCPTQDLSYNYLDDNRHGLTGCGRSTEFILICLGSQCRWAPPPLAQASFDLDCSVEKLKLVPIHDQKIGVEGCGRRGSYGWICQSVLSCDWYRDGIDGMRSEASIAAEKAAKQRAIETENLARRQTRSLEEALRNSSHQSTGQNAASAAAARGGR
jgi:hypothetical protein